MKFDIEGRNAEVEEIGSSFKNKKFFISEKNSNYFISIVNNFYSKPIPSIAREITSNCFDAHIEAGKLDEPVLIRLFADETKQLHIEFIDRGLGLSEEKFDTIFASYGESTKRDSNDFIGAFGFGSKSPFSYTPYFYLITKCEGVESLYVLNKTVQGPESDKLLETVLEDPNETGTTIRIPIKPEDLNAWKEAIKSQLKYFRNVFVVNLDGIPNDHSIREFETFKVREDLFNANNNGVLHLALGDVTYPIQFSEFQIPSINFNAALKFNIGDLDITPNREEVLYNYKTKLAITNKLNAFKEELTSLLINPNNWIYDNIKNFIIEKENFEKNKSFKVQFLDKEQVFLLNNLSFLQESNFNFRFKLDNEILDLNTKDISPNKHAVVLMKTTYTGVSKVKTNKQPSFNLFAGASTLSKIILIDDPEQKFKVHEKRWIKDHHSLIVHFESKDYLEMISANIRDNNVDLITKLSKDDIKKLEIEFFNMIENDFILASNNKYFNPSIIPPKYGAEKYIRNRVSIKKQPNTILFFSVSSRCDLSRTEELPEYFINQNTAIVFGNTDDKYLLGRLKRHFENKVITITCSEKYQKMIKVLNPDAIHINELKSSKFLLREPFLTNFKKNVETHLTNQKLNSFSYEISPHIMTSMKVFIKDAAEENNHFSNFRKALEFFEKRATKQTNGFYNEDIYEFYNDIDNLDKKTFKEIVKDIKIKVNKTYKKDNLTVKFQNDFFLEINYFNEEYESSSMPTVLKVIGHALKSKKTTLNKYLKLI